MELVKNVKEIIENAKRFDYYIECGNSDEKEFAINCIAWGKCFVVIKENNRYKFYPSKYIGYKDNSASGYYDAYYSAQPLPGEGKYRDGAYFTFDGRMSNKAITKVLGCNCVKDYSMSDKFIEYCNKYGLKGSEKRKFWLNIIEI